MAYFFTTFQSASLDYCSLFVESDPKDVVIQGSRVSVSSPWTTDDGQPLPFVGEFQGISNLAGTLRIIFTSSGKWASVNPTNVFPNAVCEIPVWDSKLDSIFHSPQCGKWIPFFLKVQKYRINNLKFYCVFWLNWSILLYLCGKFRYKITTDKYAFFLTVEN